MRDEALLLETPRFGGPDLKTLTRLHDRLVSESIDAMRRGDKDEARNLMEEAKALARHLDLVMGK